MVKVLFVCLGNICRSPLAEGIFRRQSAEATLDVLIDSAGTGHWHIGEAPDHRSIKVGEARGCDMSMRARQVTPEDFRKFDVIVAMDDDNVRDLKRVPGVIPGKIRLMRSFDPAATGLHVPDPYYGGPKDFEDVAEMLEAACAGLVRYVQELEAKKRA